jgi:hypothetical protein
METRQHTVNVSLSDDDARKALSRIFSDEATDDDYRTVRKHLRTTDEGRQSVTAALRSVSTERVMRRAIPASEQVQSVLYEFIAAKADTLREQLDAESATASERLVVEQVVDAWVRLEFVQQRYDDALLTASAPSVRLWDRLLTKSQQRYLRALESLSRVRRYDVQFVERLDADGSQQRSVGIRAGG